MKENSLQRIVLPRLLRVSIEEACDDLGAWVENTLISFCICWTNFRKYCENVVLSWVDQHSTTKIFPEAERNSGTSREIKSRYSVFLSNNYFSISSTQLHLEGNPLWFHQNHRSATLVHLSPRAASSNVSISHRPSASACWRCGVFQCSWANEWKEFCKPENQFQWFCGVCGCLFFVCFR